MITLAQVVVGSVFTIGWMIAYIRRKDKAASERALILALLGTLVLGEVLTP